MQEPSTLLLAAAGVLFIGLSKAGFGGGLGMLTTPLCVLAFSAGGKPPAFAIGVLLPLLCAGDAFSLYHYWRRWEARNLRYLLPGVVVGVVVGVQLIGAFSPRQLNLAIGILAVSFVLFQITKERIFKAEGAFQPNHAIGIPCGIGAGITSSFAHGAGPVISVFLIPQRLPKEVYVGTTVLVFTVINWIKVPFFCLDRTMIDLPFLIPRAIITVETLITSLWFLPLIPAGVWLGVWLNRRFSERWFLRAVYLLTFLAGVQLIFNFNLTGWLRTP
ncbi:MAG TPA: sulfite exporter TauE/SafE family protein [Methylomirabilota bacterium]|nr:sulfite exporter TauE/SafE family protein [Methylomirabilota bacterium]